MFFHPDGERGRARAQRERHAKEMCHRCPVIVQCQVSTHSPSPSRTASGVVERIRTQHPDEARRRPPHRLDSGKQKGHPTMRVPLLFAFY